MTLEKRALARIDRRLDNDLYAMRSVHPWYKASRQARRDRLLQARVDRLHDRLEDIYKNPARYVVGLLDGDLD